jgi:hypothetical protein
MSNLNKPAASLPPPEKSGGGKDALQSKLSTLLDELRQAARTAGVEADDPLGPLLKAFFLALEWLGACLVELRTITIDYGTQILQRSQASKAADEAATLHLEKQMEAVRLQIVNKFRADMGQDFDKLTAGRVRAEVWKISLIATGVFTASIGMSLAYGYHWGHINAQASIHETEAELRAAFKNGVSGASHWLGLMTWNDIEYALNQCATNPRLDISEHGRRACQVQLWIEEDAGSPDIVIDDIALRARKAQADLEARAEKQEAQEKAKLKLVPERGKTSK